MKITKKDCKEINIENYLTKKKDMEKINIKICQKKINKD